MRGVFVTGTDTGVGKSVVAATVCAGLAARGERVAAFKPVVTGLDEPPGEWPFDHELLAGAANAGQSPDEVAPYRFGPPASPHLAAALAGEVIEPGRLLESAQRAAASADALVVEGVGGLLVPLTEDYPVRDLVVELGLPAIVVARPGLGTINHTLLTVEALRRGGVALTAVVLNPWPDDPGAIERSNRETISRLTGVRVVTLAPTEPGELTEAAGARELAELVA